jgi:hypothetical protein
MPLPSGTSAPAIKTKTDTANVIKARRMTLSDPRKRIGSSEVPA